MIYGKWRFGCRPVHEEQRMMKKKKKERSKINSRNISFDTSVHHCPLQRNKRSSCNFNAHSAIELL